MSNTEAEGRQNRPVEATVGREAKALSYMRWHVAAYGAGAPADEIAHQCGMTLGDAQDMLEWMQMRGNVAYHESDFTHGWHETPNA